MTEVTRILNAIDQGDAQAANDLLPVVYDELRRLAAERLSHEKPGQTLQATALVHEAYLRLVGGGDVQWSSRAHFFAAAGEAMRRILSIRPANEEPKSVGVTASRCRWPKTSRSPSRLRRKFWPSTRRSHAWSSAIARWPTWPSCAISPASP